MVHKNNISYADLFVSFVGGIQDCFVLFPIDETIDDKDTCTEVTAKDTVDIILEEVLRSAIIVSYKGCNRIGDFNVIQDFCPQFDDQHPNILIKDLDNRNLSKASKEDIETKETYKESSSSEETKENIEQILDTLVKKDDKLKAVGECEVITKETLADNELQIQNGQIRIEKNEPQGLGKNYFDPTRFDFYEKKDVIKDEKIEIEYFNEGKINKIYVPLSDGNSNNSTHNSKPVDLEKDRVNLEIQNSEAKEMEDAKDEEKPTERPFKPITTEELQKSFLQVWGKVNSSAIGGWDGDMSTQSEDVIRLMEGLSSMQVYPEASSDPNRPRACAFAEEDVKKIIKEIQEISFNQSVQNSDGDLTYHPDGQGDADLESKSSIKVVEAQKSQRGKKEPSEIELKKESEDYKKLFNNNKNLTCEQDKKTGKDESNVGSDEGKMSTNPRFEGETFEGDNVECKERKRENVKNEVSLDYEVTAEENLLSSQMYVSPKRLESRMMIDSSDHINLSNVLTSAFYIAPQTKDSGTTNNDSSGNFISDSGHLVKVEIPEESSPASLSFTEKDSSHQNINKTLETRHENLKLISENDVKRPESIRSCRSVNDTSQESLPDKSHQTQGCRSLRRLKAGEGEPYDSFTSGFSLSGAKGTGLLSLNSDLGEKSTATIEGFPKVIEKTETISNTNLPSSEKEPSAETKEQLNKVNDLNLQEEKQNDDKALGDQEKTEATENNSGASTSSANEEKEEKIEVENYPQQFKLRSPKIYPKSSFDPVNRGTNELILTDSEEAIIDSTERVLQVIEPPENSADEDNEIISFSLLNESNAVMFKKAKSKDYDCDLSAEWNADKESGHNENGTTRKVYSGMTTIGPMKNVDYDPKDLTTPDIDYGKMTRITTSRILANEIFATELTVVPSVRIITEEDSEDESSTGEDRVEVSALLNRDIASLTKVQKVREVMSYQPRPEEDFDDEENLGRTRLDLKDVESMTDERYKVPEVSIPVLSFEVTNNSEEAEKDFIQNVNLLFAGEFSNNNCLENLEPIENKKLEESKSALSKPPSIKPSVSTEKPKNSGQMLPEEANFLKVQGVQLSKKDMFGEENVGEKKEENFEEKKSEILKVINSDSSSVSATRQKCATLGGVLKKASTKLIRKDDDLSLRSSRSLPRDSSKLMANDSIKSLLKDGHSSTSSVLKKSRSLLKNTQNIFKTISQGRFQPQDSAGNLGNQKPSPSESEIGNLEKKLSSFFRKEDFSKAKNLIKSKMEKTFKLDLGTSPRSSPEICPEKAEAQELRLTDGNSDSFQIDRLESFRKDLSKTPLVYKSQFVKSRISIPNVSCEKFEETGQASSATTEENPEGRNSDSFSERSKKTYIKEEDAIASVDSEIEINTSFEQVKNERKLIWVGERQEVHETRTTMQCTTEETGYIVMKTVQGLPSSDFEICSETEPNQTESVEQYKDEGRSDVQEPRPCNIQTVQVELPSYLKNQRPSTPSPPPNSPSLTEKTETVDVTPTGKKAKTKTKKFSARFRSFWTSTFGKVKTPTKKTESS